MADTPKEEKKSEVKDATTEKKGSENKGEKGGSGDKGKKKGGKGGKGKGGKGKDGKGKGGKGKDAGKAGAKDDRDEKGITTTREENFSEWYTQVILKAELIEYYDISGCYILRPGSYSVWDTVREFLDRCIKESGVQNCYFPLLVSKHRLEAEEAHIAGFAPEVAWVTKGGQTELTPPVAIRPTSETIMYPTYSKWIRSHRDLPLRLNQWANVVRWEFKHPVPFLRSREFLWQEGHSVFASKAEADKEVLEILGYYRRAYEEILAVPVIPGTKTETEKFAGGLYTTTIETLINGRGIQAATSHCLGVNFSKIFNITYESEEKKKELAWQNSWGFTTRSIGIMVMLHGDNKGLVMPPRAAPVQVVIVPITKKGKEEGVLKAAAEVYDVIKKTGIKVKLDDRSNYNPGFKYNYWELRGVPLRLELGERDLKNKQVFAARRDTGKKFSLEMADLATKVPEVLATIQGEMFANAKKKLVESVVKCTKWEEVVPALNNGCLVLAPWDTNDHSLDDVLKERSGADAAAAAAKADSETGFQLTAAAKTLCIPAEDSGFQPALPEGATCILSGKPATKWLLLGRSY